MWCPPRRPRPEDPLPRLPRVGRALGAPVRVMGISAQKRFKTPALGGQGLRAQGAGGRGVRSTRAVLLSGGRGRPQRCLRDGAPRARCQELMALPCPSLRLRARVWSLRARSAKGPTRGDPMRPRFTALTAH